MERHRTDILSLVFGVLFVGVGASILLDRLPGVGPWLWQAWPLLLMLAGVWLLIAAARSGRGGRGGRGERETDPASGDAHPMGHAAEDEEDRAET